MGTQQERMRTAAPEALRPRVVEPEEVMRVAMGPRRPAGRVELAARIVALLVVGALIGWMIGYVMYEDRTVAAERQATELAALVDGLRTSSLYDPAGLYTPAREGGQMAAAPAAPVYDATGLYTAFREGGTVVIDPTGMYTGYREGSGW